MKKQIIWTSDYENIEAIAKEEMEYRKSELDEEISEEEAIDFAYELNNDYLDDERCNLDKEVDGYIIAMAFRSSARYGVWGGHGSKGYKLCGTNVSDILTSRSDDAEWYGDGNNIRGEFSDHDGSDSVIYRVAKSEEDAGRIAEKIWSGEISSEEEFRKAAEDPIVMRMDAAALDKSIEHSRTLMQQAAKRLDFVLAAQYRDEMLKLEEIKKTKNVNANKN